MEIISRPVSYALQNVVKLINTKWCHKKIFSLKAQAFMFAAHYTYTVPCTVSVNCAEHMEKKSRPEIIFRRLVRNIFRPVRACAKRSGGKISRPEKNYHDTGTPLRG